MAPLARRSIPHKLSAASIDGGRRGTRRPGCGLFLPPVGRPFVVEMQQGPRTASFVEMAPASAVEYVAPIVFSAIALEQVIDRARIRLVRIPAKRLAGIAVPAARKAQAACNHLGRQICGHEAGDPSHLVVRIADEIFISDEEDPTAAALAESSR